MPKNPDYLLLGSAVALILAGIIILASVSAPFSQEKFGTPYYFIIHQLLYGLMPGLILGFLAFKINLARIKKLSLILLLANLVFLILVFVPGIGVKTWGASRWLNFGPLSFQPAEFLKLTFILYLASFLASKTELRRSVGAIDFGKTFIIFLAVIGLISFLLAVQPDISTLGIIILTALIMYFLANTPFWQSFLMFFLGAGGLFLLVKFAAYRFARLATFFNPDADPLGQGYQIKQALIAVGSGGLFGQGLGLSQQKFGYLPQTMSDSVFAIFSEEAGFIGAIILISLFLLFLYAGLRAAKRTANRFSRLAIIGITCWISMQAFINIASMIGIVPISGVPLPFISYGGSALIAELIGVGIILNISKEHG